MRGPLCQGSSHSPSGTCITHTSFLFFCFFLLFNYFFKLSFVIFFSFICILKSCIFFLHLFICQKKFFFKNLHVLPKTSKIKGQYQQPYLFYLCFFACTRQLFYTFFFLAIILPNTTFPITFYFYFYGKSGLLFPSSYSLTIVLLSQYKVKTRQVYSYYPVHSFYLISS